jgi:YVTN family beta-propeller protein
MLRPTNWGVAMLGANGFGRLRRTRLIALIPIITLVAVGLGMIVLRDEGTASAQNLDRFAAMTFGAQGGAAALASGPISTSESTTPATFTKYRTPNGWKLRPAGTQIDTQRAPTGVAVAPDAETAVAVNSGIFDQQITVVNTSTLTKTLEFTTDLYMGAAIDSANNLWVSTGNRNRIYQYTLAGGVATCVRCSRVLPGAPDEGPLPAINVIGYPGNMVLGTDKRLFVAGNLSVPSSYIDGKVAGAGPVCAGGSSICSVINVVDVTDPQASSPPVRYVPVGRDAFGLALNEAQGKLYVTNWADETNPSRGSGKGTVSVIDLATETEVQVVPVGHHPTAIALNPAGGTLFVANTADDSLSKLSLGADGLVTGTSTIDVRTTSEAPRAAAPLTLNFTVDGAYLLVGLAGQNAVEVRTAAGDAIPRPGLVLGASYGFALDVPHTYIPTGWYPSAMTTAAHPDVATASRLYIANLKGIGAGPGDNAQAAPTVGSRTQGVLQVIDLPVDPAARNRSFDKWTAKVVKNNKWVPLFKTSVSDPAKDPCLAAPLPGGGTTLSTFLCEQAKKTGVSPYHVVYLVKENKTFDAFFGDVKTRGLPNADADPAFLLFGEDEGMKNQHNLARLFAVGDAFWADSEQSTTGHSWTSAGYATEYNEITWNPEYSEGLRGNRWGGQYEGSTPGPTASDPEIAEQEGELFDPAERFVDLLAEPGTNPRNATFRVYSDDVNRDTPAVQQQVPLSLWGIGSSAVHHGRDLDFPDTDRARLFVDGATVSHAWSGDQGPPPPSYEKEIGFCGAPDDPLVDNAPDSFCARPGAAPGEYEKFSLDAWTAQYQACRTGGSDDKTCQSAMPNFLYMALPVDHTLGFNPLSPTPQSMVADNDYATGLIVDALSKSPFWKNTLVVITEDDTQLAGDHVDAHRTFLLTAGGLARRHGPQGAASHQAGSFPSILKTVEVLFGIRQLTIYDRAAVPLHDFVIQKGNDKNNVVYDAVDPGVPFATNPTTGTLAVLSQKVDWRLDRGDPDLVTAIMYNGIRGRPLPEKYLQLARE